MTLSLALVLVVLVAKVSPRALLVITGSQRKAATAVLESALVTVRN
ncbi:MAG: hypothetical protein V7K40_22090 [Nostoc sp.]